MCAWALGYRNLQKALLMALLTPHERLKKMQDEGRLTELLVAQEEMKTLPFSAVWAAYCDRCGVPRDGTWFADVMAYEKEVQLKRG